MLLFVLLTILTIDGNAQEGCFGCSISKIQGDKVYLKPGAIHIANNGIFINVQGQLQVIDHLDMDEEGVYFDIRKSSEYAARCRVCGFPLIFGFCLNPDCCP